ncbi:unnamed protein product [Vitrella brassicaformis CCMP3155]|uniref:Uncharacterized protein n=7 Tax=Vitrella brassicaformis TaxID=1169539 RepID=A0A0G4ECY2_VITBC|nr:unnamed protein product [Vitrella brassicaformis CCMP3155]|eukprot:CEL93188.1 unnamed protein product [Vitrella brassicaformis CCMP3155]
MPRNSFDALVDRATSSQGLEHEVENAVQLLEVLLSQNGTVRQYARQLLLTRARHASGDPSLRPSTLRRLLQALQDHSSDDPQIDAAVRELQRSAATSTADDSSHRRRHSTPPEPPAASSDPPALPPPQRAAAFESQHVSTSTSSHRGGPPGRLSHPVTVVSAPLPTSPPRSSSAFIESPRPPPERLRGSGMTAGVEDGRGGADALGPLPSAFQMRSWKGRGGSPRKAGKKQNGAKAAAAGADVRASRDSAMSTQAPSVEYPPLHGEASGSSFLSISIDRQSKGAFSPLPPPLPPPPSSLSRRPRSPRRADSPPSMLRPSRHDAVVRSSSAISLPPFSRADVMVPFAPMHVFTTPQTDRRLSMAGSRRPFRSLTPVREEALEDSDPRHRLRLVAHFFRAWAGRAVVARRERQAQHVEEFVDRIARWAVRHSGFFRRLAAVSADRDGLARLLARIAGVERRHVGTNTLYRGMSNAVLSFTDDRISWDQFMSGHWHPPDSPVPQWYRSLLQSAAVTTRAEPAQADRHREIRISRRLRGLRRLLCRLNSSTQLAAAFDHWRAIHKTRQAARESMRQAMQTAEGRQTIDSLEGIPARVTVRRALYAWSQTAARLRGVALLTARCDKRVLCGALRGWRRRASVARKGQRVVQRSSGRMLRRVFQIWLREYYRQQTSNLMLSQLQYRGQLSRLEATILRLKARCTQHALNRLATLLTQRPLLKHAVLRLHSHAQHAAGRESAIRRTLRRIVVGRRHRMEATAFRIWSAQLGQHRRAVMDEQTRAAAAARMARVAVKMRTRAAHASARRALHIWRAALIAHRKQHRHMTATLRAAFIAWRQSSRQQGRVRQGLLSLCRVTRAHTRRSLHQWLSACALVAIEGPINARLSEMSVAREAVESRAASLEEQLVRTRDQLRDIISRRLRHLVTRMGRVLERFALSSAFDRIRAACLAERRVQAAASRLTPALSRPARRAMAIALASLALHAESHMHRQALREKALHRLARLISRRWLQWGWEGLQRVMGAVMSHQAAAAMRADLDRRAQRIDHLQASLRDQEKQCEELQASLERKRAEEASRRAELDELQSNLQERTTALHQTRHELQDTTDKREIERLDAEDSLKKLQDTVAELTEALQVQQGELETTQRALEDEQAANRYLMSSAQDGQAGRVDLFQRLQTRRRQEELNEDEKSAFMALRYHAYLRSTLRQTAVAAHLRHRRRTFAGLRRAALHVRLSKMRRRTAVLQLAATVQRVHTAQRLAAFGHIKSATLKRGRTDAAARALHGAISRLYFRHHCRPALQVLRRHASRWLLMDALSATQRRCVYRRAMRRWREGLARRKAAVRVQDIMRLGALRQGLQRLRRWCEASRSWAVQDVCSHEATLSRVEFRTQTLRVALTMGALIVRGLLRRSLARLQTHAHQSRMQQRLVDVTHFPRATRAMTRRYFGALRRVARRQRGAVRLVGRLSRLIERDALCVWRGEARAVHMRQQRAERLHWSLVHIVRRRLKIVWFDWCFRHKVMAPNRSTRLLNLSFRMRARYLRVALMLWRADTRRMVQLRRVGAILARCIARRGLRVLHQHALSAATEGWSRTALALVRRCDAFVDMINHQADHHTAHESRLLLHTTLHEWRRQAAASAARKHERRKALGRIGSGLQRARLRQSVRQWQRVLEQSRRDGERKAAQSIVVQSERQRGTQSIAAASRSLLSTLRVATRRHLATALTRLFSHAHGERLRATVSSHRDALAAAEKRHDESRQQQMAAIEAVREELKRLQESRAEDLEEEVERRLQGEISRSNELEDALEKAQQAVSYWESEHKRELDRNEAAQTEISKIGKSVESLRQSHAKELAAVRQDLDKERRTNETLTNEASQQRQACGSLRTRASEADEAKRENQRLRSEVEGLRRRLDEANEENAALQERMREEIERVKHFESSILKGHKDAESFKKAAEKQVESLKLALKASKEKATLYAEQVSSLSTQLSESAAEHRKKERALLEEKIQLARTNLSAQASSSLTIVPFGQVAQGTARENKGKKKRQP